MTRVLTRSKLSLAFDLRTLIINSYERINPTLVVNEEEAKLADNESLLLDNEYIIISEVAENENITQRELSKKMGVSVSTVNMLMNKMIREGFIKMTQVSQKQVLYMLTPNGMMEKAQKTVKYLKAHYKAIFETKEKIKSFLNRLTLANDVIYVLICNDEMSEILAIAVHEYESKHGETNIKIIYNKKDIEETNYNSPILLHMNVNEDILKEYIDIAGLKTINLAERL